LRIFHFNQSKDIQKMKAYKLRATVVACALATLGGHAMAEEDMTKAAEAAVKRVLDATGLEFAGYMRAGFHGSSSGTQLGGYSLGGDLQFYRLGNEGNNYLEFMLGKNFDLGNGLKWGVHYMPTLNNGNTGTSQLYTEISGLDIAPEASVWAGQRWHRIQDIHIVDNFLAVDGDNFGAGVDGIPVGGAKLNIAAYTDGSFDNKNNGNGHSTNDATRLNFQLRGLPVNPGGKLTITGAVVSGTFAKGSNGNAWGLIHNQDITPEINNTVFLQGSTGHANITGKFYNLDTPGAAATFTVNPDGTVTGTPATAAGPQGGANQFRLADSINWQLGAFGGQALIGYQTLTPDGGTKITDTSIGGRISYGVAKNVKLLTELAVTQRNQDGMDTKTLSKATVAVAFSPDTKFWTRPELRLYATRFNWNDAAKSSMGSASNRNDVTLFGVQVEAWW